jgi:hypothetical protein
LDELGASAGMLANVVPVEAGGAAAASCCLADLRAAVAALLQQQANGLPARAGCIASVAALLVATLPLVDAAVLGGALSTDDARLALLRVGPGRADGGGVL